MKIDKSARVVTALHVVSLLFGAVIGLLVAGSKHPALGASLGAFIGTIVPGLIGHIALKLRRERGSILRLCGAVFSNEWIETEDMRPTVEDIRGITMIVWMGFFSGALLAVFAWSAGPWLCLAVSTGGAALGWLFSKTF
jgi:hypothetical protein